MNVNEYTASGIVELYAMNALTPEDRKEFERLMILYPEIREELGKTEMALEDFAMNHSRNPRPRLRAKVMNKIFGEEKENRAGAININSAKENSVTYKYLIA